jgi:hypothetical protein
MEMACVPALLLAFLDWPEFPYCHPPSLGLSHACGDALLRQLLKVKFYLTLKLCIGSSSMQ